MNFFFNIYFLFLKEEESHRMRESCVIRLIIISSNYYGPTETESFKCTNFKKFNTSI